ncbi:hypothetical protein AKJ16_DCAP00588 [Drosera capensis]
MLLLDISKDTKVDRNSTQKFIQDQDEEKQRASFPLRFPKLQGICALQVQNSDEESSGNNELGGLYYITTG